MFCLLDTEQKCFYCWLFYKPKLIVAPKPVWFIRLDQKPTNPQKVSQKRHFGARSLDNLAIIDRIWNSFSVSGAVQRNTDTSVIACWLDARSASNKRNMWRPTVHRTAHVVSDHAIFVFVQGGGLSNVRFRAISQ